MTVVRCKVFVSIYLSWLWFVWKLMVDFVLLLFPAFDFIFSHKLRG